MKSFNLEEYKDTIPKSSKFAIGDWILKVKGQFYGSIAQVIGYQKKYGPGNYLIEFEDGRQLRTKQKYFRGPYISKEAAQKYQKNRSLQDEIEDMRMKPHTVSVDYQRQPRIESEIKERFTQSPYNFQWLETPITFPYSEDTMITILATRQDEQVSLTNPYKSQEFLKHNINQMFIGRYNYKLTKKTRSYGGSPYVVVYPQKSLTIYSSDKVDYNKLPLEQVDQIFRLSNTSYQKTLGEINIEERFESYNRFLSLDKLTPTDLVEIIGGLKIEGGKKILRNHVDFEFLKGIDKKIVRDYHLFHHYTFFTNIETNLDNCPKSAPKIVVQGVNLLSLSSSNHPEVKRIELYLVPKIKNFKGLETFQGIEDISIGFFVDINLDHFKSFESLEGCPKDIDLTIKRLPKLKTLKGLPSSLKSLMVHTELDSFGCADTIIKGELVVYQKPKSLQGLPKASKYRIEGWTQEQIDEELKFQMLRKKLPELEGIFE